MELGAQYRGKKAGMVEMPYDKEVDADSASLIAGTGTAADDDG